MNCNSVKCSFKLSNLSICLDLLYFCFKFVYESFYVFIPFLLYLCFNGYVYFHYVPSLCSENWIGSPWIGALGDFEFLYVGTYNRNLNTLARAAGALITETSSSCFFFFITVLKTFEGKFIYYPEHELLHLIFILYLIATKLQNIIHLHENVHYLCYFR